MARDDRELALLPAVDIGTFERVALFADVHGNAEALDAVLKQADVAGCDAMCFLGCLTWGPEPMRVLDLANDSGRPSFFLRGNGERAVLELANGGRPSMDPVLERWMVRAHGEEGLRRIRNFPKALTMSISGASDVRLCHGSPRSDVELLSPRATDERVEQACDGAPERTIVHGHTHLQYQRTVGGRLIAGCGSVGLPYTDEPPAALWSMVDADGVHAMSTDYDIDAAERAVERAGYPSAERFLTTLRQPPRPADVMLDCETRQFSD